MTDYIYASDVRNGDSIIVGNMEYQNVTREISSPRGLSTFVDDWDVSVQMNDTDMVERF